MGAIGVHHTATSEGGWDGPGNKARLRTDGDQAYYRQAYAWQDPDGDPATKAAYKFIHHEISADGSVGAANLRGCSTGIGVLNGGRGGTTIPSGDRQGVYNHLAAHLRDGDMEPPDLRSEQGGHEGGRPAGRPYGEGEDVERRVLAADLELREDADGPVIEGYAAVFDQWSQDLGGFVERIARGFFRDVLDQDVRALWQHDPSYVLGRTVNRTLELVEDRIGLKVRIRPPESGWAKDALVSLRRGDVSQMSFGFQVDTDEWEQAKGGGVARRTLVKARALFDVSPVTFAAYPQTTVIVRQHAADLRAQAAAAGLDELSTDGQAQEEATRARESLTLRIITRQREV